MDVYQLNSSYDRWSAGTQVEIVDDPGGTIFGTMPEGCVGVRLRSPIPAMGGTPIFVVPSDDLTKRRPRQEIVNA